MNKTADNFPRTKFSINGLPIQNFSVFQRVNLNTKRYDFEIDFCLLKSFCLLYDFYRKFPFNEKHYSIYKIAFQYLSEKIIKKCKRNFVVCDCCWDNL